MEKVVENGPVCTVGGGNLTSPLCPYMGGIDCREWGRGETPPPLPIYGGIMARGVGTDHAVGVALQ